MSDFLASHTLEYSLKVPHDPLAIVLWILWFGVLVFLAFRFRERDTKLDKKSLIWLAGLSLSVLIFTPFFGVSLGDQHLAGASHYFMFFVAVPWLIAGGVLGTLPAALLAGMSGLLAAYLDTHSIFTPLVFVTAALCFSLCVRQRYRTFGYQLLRFPLIAAFITSLVTIPFLFLALLLSGSDELTVRIVDIVGGLPEAWFSFLGMMMIGGVISLFARLINGKAWGSQSPMQPAPGEVSLKFRWMVVAVPLVLVLLLTLAVGSWTIAEKYARRSMVIHLTSTGYLASEGVQVFVETGESLILEAAGNEILAADTGNSLPDQLAGEMESLAFFDRLAVVNTNGELIAMYPSGSMEDLALTASEISALLSAGKGTVSLIVNGSSGEGEHSRMVSFITSMGDSSEGSTSVLCGLTDITTNPYFHSVAGLLDELEATGGVGQVINEDGFVLFHSDSQEVMGAYTGVSYPTATFFEGTSADGQVWMQFYHPIEDTGWAVVTAYPTQSVQVTAWQTISPILLISTIALVIILFTGWMGLTALDKEIQCLESAADKLIQGDYTIDLSTRGSSGGMKRLTQVFQRMIISLQKKERKQSSLLSLTEKITGQLTLKDSLQIVLMAALERGVSSARIVLLEASDKNAPQSLNYRFGLGEHTRQLASLDQDVLAMAQSQGTLLFRDSQIERMFTIQKVMPLPAALIAVPLKWKESRLGVLWVAYSDQRNPGSSEIEFFTDLSKKASIAIINARAFDKSITIKNQLETVLDVLLDPVLIADDYGKIVYLNKAAQALIRQGKERDEELTLSSVFDDERLLSFLREARQESKSSEISLRDNKTYHITATPIQIEDRQMGVAVLFKDITEYRAQESKKAELITTVNHELRAPLTLVQGFAKILRLTGNLNEQQSGYVNNIIDGVEEMKDLVQNLLDLDRLESVDLTEITRVDAGVLVKQVVDGLAAQAKQKNLQIGLSLPEGPVTLEADAAYLTQALKNLVENAIKFSKMGGSVQVSVSQEDEAILFSVQDSGIGVAPLDQQHLFEKFYRASAQAGEEQKGSGLGLAIVKSIAVRHHGKVWVESKLGRGSTFFLQIPTRSV